jgi:serine acetyltransferase
MCELVGSEKGLFRVALLTLAAHVWEKDGEVSLILMHQPSSLRHEGTLTTRRSAGDGTFLRFVNGFVVNLQVDGGFETLLANWTVEGERFFQLVAINVTV